MRLSELQKLINKYGESTKFIEIKEELHKNLENQKNENRKNLKNFLKPIDKCKRFDYS